MACRRGKQGTRGQGSTSRGAVRKELNSGGGSNFEGKRGQGRKRVTTRGGGGLVSATYLQRLFLATTRTYNDEKRRGHPFCIDDTMTCTIYEAGGEGGVYQNERPGKSGRGSRG